MKPPKAKSGKKGGSGIAIVEQVARRMSPTKHKS